MNADKAEMAYMIADIKNGGLNEWKSSISLPVDRNNVTELYENLKI